MTVYIAFGFLYYDEIVMLTLCVLNFRELELFARGKAILSLQSVCVWIANWISAVVGRVLSN